MRRIATVLAAALLAVGAAACGKDAPAPTTPSGPLSIEEAIATSPGGTIAVRGFVVAPEGEPTMLCSTLLESYPPQCGGPSLTVEGLDLSTVDGLTGTTDPTLTQVQWTDREVPVQGLLDDGTLVVG